MIKANRLVVFNQSSGYLMTDIINSNYDDYQEVILVTGKHVARQKKLKDNVKIKKTIAYNRSSFIPRLLTWIVGYLQMCVYALRYQYKSHFLLVSNPPFSFFIPLKWTVSYSLLVYDVYPNVLVDYNYIKESSLLVKIWKSLNRKIYKRANAIYTISEGMRKLLSEFVSDEKVQVIPIWTDNEFLKPMPKSENIFLKDKHFQDKFIVQYSGNIGMTHSIEILIEVARQFKHVSNIHFLIIGEGKQKINLISKAQKYGLQNISFLPWQAASMLPYSLAAADIGIVSLASKASNLSVPSKTFNLMSVGVPVICIAEPQSELANLMQRYNFGLCADSSNLKAITNFILDLSTKPEIKKMYSDNALLASLNFTIENATKIK